MCLNPAMGAKVHGDAGGEQNERDAERTGNPFDLDAALQDEEVQDAEDEHQDRRLGEEGRTASARDDSQNEQRGRLADGTSLARRNEAQACWVWYGSGVW